MRKILIAAAAGLMTLSALPFTAAAEPQMRPYTQQAPTPPQRPDRHDGPMNGPMSGPMNGPGHNDNGPGRGDDRYGRWDSSWGSRPNGPPRGWTRTNDWYRHVRACSQRYRSYNPRTDTYVVRHGRTAMCRL
ncbi:hypothetical protein BH09PSE1_BH09PSE1_29220 [soil metagenome]